MGQYITERRLPSRFPPQPEFYQLSIFLKVAETRSFTATARLTGRTQPAISQAIARLEDIYGGDLFERRRGAPLALTPIGEAILPSARALIETLDHQMTNAARTAQSKAGSLTLGIQSGLAAGPHRAALGDFIAASPGVQLRLIEAAPGEQLRKLNERALDLMIVAAPSHFAGSNLMQEPLWCEQLFVAMPAHHEFVWMDKLDWSTVASMPLLVTGSSSEGDGRLLFGHPVTSNLALEQHAVSFDVLLDMVGLGMGSSIVFGSATMPHRDVVFRPIVGENVSVAIEAIWRRHDGNPMRHRLLNYIRARLAADGKTLPSARPPATAPAPDHG